MFSAGKSSLLNDYLQDKILSTNIAAETALPVEIHYTEEQESIYLVDTNNEKQHITRQQLLSQDFTKNISKSALHHHVEFNTPNKILQSIPNISLIDMPGINSGFKGHEDAIQQYLTNNQNVIGVVISIEEGAISHDLKKLLSNLSKDQEFTILLIITKCDKKLPTEIIKIQKLIISNLQEISPLANIKLITYSVDEDINLFTKNQLTYALESVQKEGL